MVDLAHETYMLLVVAHKLVKPRERDTHHSSCCLQALDDGNTKSLDADVATRRCAPPDEAFDVRFMGRSEKWGGCRRGGDGGGGGG